MTAALEAELAELLKRATPIPWESQNDENAQANIYGADHDHWIALLPHQCVRSLELLMESNAALIVGAVNALPALLDELKRLRKALVETSEVASDTYYALCKELADATRGCRECRAELAAARAALASPQTEPEKTK